MKRIWENSWRKVNEFIKKDFYVAFCFDYIVGNCQYFCIPYFLDVWRDNILEICNWSLADCFVFENCVQ